MAKRCALKVQGFSATHAINNNPHWHAILVSLIQVMTSCPDVWMVDGDADCESLVCLLLWTIEIHVMGVEICGVNVCILLMRQGLLISYILYLICS